MKKSFTIILFVLVSGLFLAHSAAAITTIYTIPTSDLSNPHFITQWGTESGRSTVSGYVRYTYSAMDAGGSIGTGDSFDYDNTGFSNNAGFGIASMPIDGGGLGDLTAFTDYSLVFHNPNADPIHVNLFMNTGWTDGGVEPDNFYQNGWTWLDPGAKATLNIDLTTAVAFSGPDVTPGVDNLNHVSNIGFMASMPGPGPSYSWGGGTPPFHVDVAPIPEPSTLLLLGSGLLGMGVLNRGRQRPKKS